MRPGRHNITHISYSDSEYQKLRGFFERSSCKSLCEYGRKVLLHEPVNFHYRDASMDDMLEELVRLRMDLKTVLCGFGVALGIYRSGRRDPVTARDFESAVEEQLRPNIGKVMAFISNFWDIWLQNSVEARASNRF